LLLPGSRRERQQGSSFCCGKSEGREEEKGKSKKQKGKRKKPRVGLYIFKREWLYQ